jgi:hypothetical protein
VAVVGRVIVIVMLKVTERTGIMTSVAHRREVVIDNNRNRTKTADNLLKTLLDLYNYDSFNCCVALTTVIKYANWKEL